MDLRTRERNLFSFINDRWIGKSYFLLLQEGKPCVRLAARWFTLPPVAAVSANISQYQKHQMDLSPTTENIEFWPINPKTTNVFLSPCLGDATISLGFRKNFNTRRMVTEPRNKAKIKKISPLSVSFLFFLAAFKQEDASELDGIRRN